MNKAALQKYSGLLLVLALFVASFILRFLALSQTEFANGWDSYFYLVQLKAWFEEGAMHSPDMSLIYPLMIAIQWIINDYVLTYKITAALLSGLFTVVMYLNAKKWGQNNSIAIFIAGFTLFSPQLTYFASQYPKNLSGLVLLLCFLLTLQRKKMYAPILIIILNFFGHRLTALLSVAIGVLFLLMKKKPRLIVLTLFSILLLFLIAGLLLPGIFSIADFERVQGQLSIQPQFAPYSFYTSFGKELLSPYWIAELIVACLIMTIAIIQTLLQLFKENTNPFLATLTLVLLFLIFPFLKWSIEEISFRFFLVFVLLAPLLLIYFTSYISRRYIALPLTFIAISLSLVSFRSYNPAKHDPPYKSYRSLADKIISITSKKDIELIISHKALAEYITFTTGTDAMPWIPEYAIDENKLWRTATDISTMQLEYYLSPEAMKEVYRLDINYFLLKEKDWSIVKEKARIDDPELYQRLNSWKNPYKIRPYYLLKNKK